MEKTGRNDPCPCGSGKKYKNCCYGKEAKKTYTPSGKRKFTAKVISVTDKSQDVFQNVGTLPPMPSAAEPFEALRFRQTKRDYQVKLQEGEEAAFKAPLPEQAPISVEGAPEVPPDDFKLTVEDYRQ